VPAVLLSTVSVLGSGSAAAHDGQLNCRVQHETAFAPGVSMAGGAGTFSSAKPGVIACTGGNVNGHVATGPGMFTQKGRYGTKDPDTCLGGEGEGSMTISIPTDAGVQTVTREFRFTFGEPSVRGGVIAGKVEGNDFYGTLDAIPLDGDCVLRPVTRVYVMADLTFFAA
jgi:hypothetical protein